MATQIETPTTVVRDERSFSRPAARIHLPRAIPTRDVAAAAPATGAVATHTAASVLLSGLSLVAGYQWLVSGVDKVLLGNFGQSIRAMMQSQIHDERIPGFFRGALSSLVLPNADLFGTIVMAGEALAGAGLIIAGLVYLLRPYLDRATGGGPLAVVYQLALRALSILAPLAALATVFMGLNYYLMDGLPTPFFQPSTAIGGAIDSSLLMALFGAILLVGQFVERKAR